MKASDVKPAMQNLDLDLEVVEIEEPHEFSNKNGEGRVATAICRDESGKIKVSLWNEDIDRIEVGDRIKVEGGYSRLFKDEVHVSAGKYGELKVVDNSSES